jgi:hypothetical protein
MNSFEQAGEAMLLAQEGNKMIAAAIISAVRGWVASFRGWLAHMPTTLPPTESIRR